MKKNIAIVLLSITTLVMGALLYQAQHPELVRPTYMTDDSWEEYKHNAEHEHTVRYYGEPHKEEN